MNQLVQVPAQATSIVPFEHQRVLAEAIAASGLFGMKTPEQALVLMALCEAEGLHPIRAAQDYHIINGRPSMKAEAMMARFQAAGGVIRWLENSDTACSAEFVHPSSPAPVTIAWDMERAKKAQLMNLESAPFIYAARSRQAASMNVSASVRASTGVSDS